MELDVRPEPTPEERQALAQALARAVASKPDAERSAWWRIGVRENVLDAPEPERERR